MEGDEIGEGANKTVVLKGLPILPATWLIRVPVKAYEGFWDLDSDDESPAEGEKAPSKSPRIKALKSSLSALLFWSTTTLSSVLRKLSARWDWSWCSGVPRWINLVLEWVDRLLFLRLDEEPLGRGGVDRLAGVVLVSTDVSGRWHSSLNCCVRRRYLAFLTI